MNKKLILICLFMLLPYAVNAATEKQLINESKLAMKRYRSVLKHTLKKAMGEGDIVSAVSSCHVDSDKITKQLTAQSGWDISRTSLKVRNPDNKADAWEEKVLKSFEKRMSRGESIKQLEHSEVISKGKEHIFRYMKAIPTQGLCLSCHGEKLDSDVQKKLKQLYPNDQATGYKVNEIRGAFTITRKID